MPRLRASWRWRMSSRSSPPVSTAEELALQRLLVPKDPAGRQQHLPRGPRRHRRRRGGAVCGRSLPHVRPLRGVQALGGRDLERESRRARRLQGDHQPHHRQGRVFAAQVRVGHASRAARPCHRGSGPHPHLRRHRRHPSRARGGRVHRAEPGGSAHRHLPLLRRRRPARQQDRLGDPGHAPADRHRGRMPGRALAAQESLARAVAPEGPAPRERTREAGLSSGADPASFRSARATGRSASAPTISRKAGSPITASI